MVWARPRKGSHHKRGWNGTENWAPTYTFVDLLGKVGIMEVSSKHARELLDKFSRRGEKTGRLEALVCMYYNPFLY